MRKIRTMNKRGWIRIVEVFIAILIIMSAVLVIMSKQRIRPDISKEVYDRQKQILDIISRNNSLRNLIVEVDLTNTENGVNIPEINEKIEIMLPPTWDFATNVCTLDYICPNPEPTENIYDKEVYVTERVVTANLTKYEPKKLKFFVWVG